MEYTQVKSLVPQGEQFDSTAVNEGVWLSQGHLASLESNLAANAGKLDGANALVTSATAERDAAQASLKTAEKNLSTANETIVSKDKEIGTLNAKVSTLEQGTAEPKQTAAAKQETGNKKVVRDNPMNKLADSLLGAPKEAVAEAK